MNRFFLLLCFFTVFISCEENKYTISGNFISNVNISDSVYLQKIDNGKVITIDRAVVNEGNFYLEGNCEEKILCYLISIVNGKPHVYADLFLEPGNIILNIGKNMRPELSGTILNVRLQEYKDSIDIINNMFKRYYEKSKQQNLSDNATKEAEKGMKILSIVRNDYINKFIEKNIDNQVSTYILAKNHEIIFPEKGLELISRMPFENKQDTLIKHIEQTFRNKVLTAEGNMFVDFEAFTNDGKKVQLSDYVSNGKIVVLNIWSTNNLENLIELKTIADVYRERVVFVGFIVDTDENRWNKIIKEHDMWWYQISDLKGWGSKAVFSYGINQCPYNIVFDSNGVILRKGVRTIELQTVLNEFVK